MQLTGLGRRMGRGGEQVSESEIGEGPQEGAES